MNDTLLKRWIAFTGIGLPILLLLRDWSLLPSMSASYYTPARDIFVGGLAVIGGALGTYRRRDAGGRNDPRDTRAALIASFGAMGVAGFPMAPPGAVGGLEVQGGLHFGFAVAFFAAIAAMCLRLFVLMDTNPTPQKRVRNWVYRACGWAIIAGLAALVPVCLLIDRSPWVFWIEAVMCWAFGLAFLCKSGLVLRDKVPGFPT